MSKAAAGAAFFNGGFPATSPTGCAGRSIISRGALQILDMVASAIVEEPSRNDRPAAPSEGSSYIVGAAPSGAWVGKAGQVATMSQSGWRFLAAVDGLSALVRSNRLRAEDFGGNWKVGTVRAERMEVDGEQVVSAQAAAIASPSGGSTIDAEARGSIDQIRAALREHGLVANIREAAARGIFAHYAPSNCGISATGSAYLALAPKPALS